MKKLAGLITFVFISFYSSAQENAITLSGGYSFATIEDSDVKTSGWRINGVYEFNSSGGKFAHGLSIGYASLTGNETNGANSFTYNIGTWPIYYAPKFLFGNEKIKGFVKGAVGYQFSSLKRTGTIAELNVNDSGFTGGGGVGASYSFNEKIFLNAEYEIIWMSNSYYKDGWLNTASIGLGIRF